MRYQQFTNLGRRWADAEWSADIAALDAVLADDFICVGPLGFVLDKEQYLKPRRRGDLQYRSLVWDEVRVRSYGDTAVAMGSQTQQSTYQGRDASGRFRVTQVAARVRGDWAIVGLHHNQIAKPSGQTP